MPVLTPIESSNVRAIGYQQSRIFVAFANGSLYRFEQATAGLFQEFMAAESKGKFFHARIKTHLPYTRLDDPTMPDVPEGFYAIQSEDDKLRFWQVYRPAQGARQGKLCLKQCFGAPGGLRKEWVRDPRPVLAELLKHDLAEAKHRFASELGHCYVCGSPLTDEQSRARGIGPVCWEKGYDVDE